MIKKIKYTFFLLLILLIAFAIYVFSLDDNFKVERSRVINAPANLVYNEISDLKNWEKWSPWKEKDTTLVFEYSKSTDKEGDYFRFIDERGNPQKLTNLTLQNDTLIIQNLGNQERLQEFKWQIIPQKDKVKLIWTVSGELPLTERFYAKQMNEMIGPMMTRGLERIDNAVHKDMEKHETKIDKIVDLGSTYYLYKAASCKIKDLGKMTDSILPEVLIYTIKNHIKMNGKPFVIYQKYDTDNNSVIFSSCIPTTEKIEADRPDILTAKTTGGKYFRAIFTGDYKFLREGWQTAKDSLSVNKEFQKDATRNPFEIYTKGHTYSQNPANWETEIYIPVIKKDTINLNKTENDK